MNIQDALTPIKAYQGREEPERLFALAGMYWRLMLFVEFIVFCAAVGIGAYLLVMTFFGFGSGKSADAQPQNLNKAQLENIVQGLQTRQDLFQQLEAGGAAIPDPSR